MSYFFLPFRKKAWCLLFVINKYLSIKFLLIIHFFSLLSFQVRIIWNWYRYYIKKKLDFQQLSIKKKVVSKRPLVVQSFQISMDFQYSRLAVQFSNRESPSDKIIIAFFDLLFLSLELWFLRWLSLFSLLRICITCHK